LTAWAHCRALLDDELFLLNLTNPGSFDSCYFGPIDTSFVRGLGGPINDERAAMKTQRYMRSRAAPRSFGVRSRCTTFVRPVQTVARNGRDRAAGTKGNGGEQDKRAGTRRSTSPCLHMSWRGTQVRRQRAARVRATRPTLELARAVYARVRWPLPALAECARPTKIDFAFVSRL
jgi:hypothetical protein